MSIIDKFKIDLKALEEGDNTMGFDFGDEYFMALEDAEIKRGDMHVDMSIRKTTRFFDVRYHIAGTVEVECDRCLDPMDQSVEADQQVTVKLGSEYSEDDDMIIVDEDEQLLDLSWHVYETIVLNLPVKHVHAPGKCNPAMINILDEYSATRSDDTEDEQPIDPRWSKLAQLKMEN